MPALYLFEHEVTETDIDGQGHANNISYLKWLQNAAIAHSDVQGWNTNLYKEHGWAWVVRSHFIEYRRPVFQGDAVVIKTWVHDMKKYSSLRKYEILNSKTEKLVARAETNWAFVATETGRLIAIPEIVSSAFEIPQSSNASLASLRNIPEAK
ncbi:acyl-CoA thioesterase [Thalassoglobus sp.]|uniref:acyl-CoA thioesterase n=1 Tax=Thalassoglobus sp. TaxID=2795869 RepID=UPI003AA9D95F